VSKLQAVKSPHTAVHSAGVAAGGGREHEDGASDLDCLHHDCQLRHLLPRLVALFR